MLELDKELSEKYDFEIKSIIPYKDAYILNASIGKKLLKRSFFSPDRIMFSHEAKEHLCRNGFPYIDRYLCTLEGKPYVIIEGDIYTVTDIIDGRECNFDNRKDISGAATLLASMHKASRGFIPSDPAISRDDLGKLPLYFIKRLDEIKRLKKAAKKGKNRFDYLFLEHVDYFYSIGENAIDLISNSNYNEIVNKTRKDGLFCHHDFTHHNIINNENKLYLTNFDFCCFELKVYDIANFLRRKMRKCNWDINEARVILNEYRKTEPVESDEFFIMKLILQFPQKFWRVINKYYNSKHGWSEKSYVSKLQEVIDEIEYHKNFMEKFDSLY